MNSQTRRLFSSLFQMNIRNNSVTRLIQNETFCHVHASVIMSVNQHVHRRVRSEMRQLQDRGNTREQVWDQVVSRVRGKIAEEVHNQAYWHLYDQVLAPLHELIVIQLDDRIKLGMEPDRWSAR